MVGLRELRDILRNHYYYYCRGITILIIVVESLFILLSWNHYSYYCRGINILFIVVESVFLLLYVFNINQLI